MESDMKKLPECPFFDHLWDRRVVCEGLYEDSALNLRFKKRKKLTEHLDRYCCSMDWEQCPIAKMLYAKYE